MEAIFRKESNTLPFSVASNGTAIEAGEVVVVTGVKVVGIAYQKIPAGESGTLWKRGVFECACPASHAAIAQGDNLYFDESEDEITPTAAGNLFIGTAHKAALANSTTVYVDFDADVCAAIAASAAAYAAADTAAIAAAVAAAKTAGDLAYAAIDHTHT